MRLERDDRSQFNVTKDFSDDGQLRGVWREHHLRIERIVRLALICLKWRRSVAL